MPLDLWIDRAGPVAWPLLAVSFVTVAILIERALFWSREWTRDPQRSLEAARSRTDQRALDEAEVERLLDREERRLARGLGWLDTAVTAAPMLGILGTVLGIIDSFDALGTDTVTDPFAVSGGIGQALITTAAGLVIALVALLPYNALRALVAQRIARLEREWRRIGERG